MSGLDDYTTDGQDQQKQTHITLVNPDHPDVSRNYADPETMKEHFEAARSIKNSRLSRPLLAGDFLVAVNKEFIEREEGAVEEFLQSLSDSEESSSEK